MSVLEIIIATSVILFILFIFAYKLLDEKSKEKAVKDKTNLLVMRKRTFWQNYNRFAQKSYINFLRIPFLKTYTKNIRQRVEMINSYDEYRLRKEIMNIVFVALGASAFVVLLLMLIFKSLIVIFWALLAVIFLNGFFIDLFVYRLEDKLLQQLKDFISDLRHHYHSSNIVDESFYNAIQTAGHEMKLQGEQIHEILTSTEPFEAFRKYEDVAPNRFLKALAGISVWIMEHGDKKDDRGSVYLRGLSGLTKEINYEILRRKRLSYTLRGMSIVAVVPIFFASPLKEWAITNFPIMSKFYESRLGFLSQILVYILILISYVLIRKMREISEAKYNVRTKKILWEEKLYRWKPIRVIVDAFAPSQNKKEHFTYTMLLKQANSPLKIEWLYLHRILFAFFTVILTLSFFFYTHYATEKNTLYSIDTNFLIGQMTEKEKQKAQEITDFDREVILHFRKAKTKTQEDIKNRISEMLGTNDEVAIEIATERIVKKLEIIDNAYFKWWELLISLVLGLGAYYIPIVSLMWQKYMRQADMEDEVNQYYTIIGIISEFERASVENILEWMERFSVIFKEPLRNAILNYDSGAELALYQLKEEVSFVSFNRIVDRLLLAISQITVKEVFDDIHIEKQFYIEQRNEHHEKVLKEKAWWGQVISFTPGGALLFLYLIVPIFYVAIVEMGDMVTNLSNL